MRPSDDSKKRLAKEIEEEKGDGKQKVKGD